MMEIPGRREITSEVRFPNRWVALLGGSVHLLIGAACAIPVILGSAPFGMPPWAGLALASAAALLGISSLGWWIRETRRPARIRHAAPEVLPDVDRCPEKIDVPFYYVVLTHEMVGDGRAWEFRPRRRLWLGIIWSLFGFGILALGGISGILALMLHHGPGLAWPASILVAAIGSAPVIGFALLAIGILARSKHRYLCRLRIPRGEGDLEWDVAREPHLGKVTPASYLAWASRLGIERDLRTIPRDRVVAVQLCPPAFEGGRLDGYQLEDWMFQGLLVLARPAKGGYRRLPILLTSDLIGAARLMRQLADALEVPFLYNANSDAGRWRTETFQIDNQ